MRRASFCSSSRASTPPRIGVIGFCMGGGFALMFAARAPIGVAATFYGDVPKTTEQLRGVCPVLGGYGGQDRLFAGQGRRLENLLTEMGVDHDVKVYEDAGHSFMSRNSGFLPWIGKIGPMKADYNPEAAEDSWKRIEAFFEPPPRALTKSRIILVDCPILQFEYICKISVSMVRAFVVNRHS